LAGGSAFPPVADLRTGYQTSDLNHWDGETAACVAERASEAAQDVQDATEVANVSQEEDAHIASGPGRDDEQANAAAQGNDLASTSRKSPQFALSFRELRVIEP